MQTAAKNTLALIFGGLLLLAAGTWSVVWFLDNFERKERAVRSDYSPMARRNPFLAAERYLTRLGHKVQSLSGREWLTHPPQESGVLFVNHLGPSLPPEREQALLQWIENGGHLVVVARQLWDEEELTSGNSLLDRVGVLLLDAEVPEASEDNETPEIDRVRLQLDSEDATDPDNPTYQLSFRANRILEDSNADASWSLSGDQGVHLLEWDWGEGWITVLSDNDLLGNDELGERDHAWFLSYLVGGEPNIWLLYSSNMPSLLSLLWRHMPYLVTSLTLLLIVMLWRMTLSTGPQLVRSTSIRRNLLEHLRAAAAYAWRTDRARALFLASQTRVEQHWRRRHPVLERLDRQQRCEWIARKTGLDKDAVGEALYGGPADEQALIRISAVQQRLIKYLSRVATR